MIHVYFFSSVMSFSLMWVCQISCNHQALTAIRKWNLPYFHSQTCSECRNQNKIDPDWFSHVDFIMSQCCSWPQSFENDFRERWCWWTHHWEIICHTGPECQNTLVCFVCWSRAPRQFDPPLTLTLKSEYLAVLHVVSVFREWENSRSTDSQHNSCLISLHYMDHRHLSGGEIC